MTPPPAESDPAPHPADAPSPAWTPLCAAAEAKGGRACVRRDGKSYLVLDTPDGWRALVNVCPHAGLPLDEGEVRGATLTCPYHGYTFSLRNGKDLGDPDFGEPLTLLPVREHGGRIEAQLGGAEAS
ncbi:MAG: Rieske (2Fe-2S) protein [Planctomycetota bacterium]